MSETISVVVCCYNAETTIAETLASLQLQTWATLEILVIDDGSTDGSVEIARSIVLQDSRMRLLVNDQNRGTAWTRQRGLEEASHELIMFFDADDIAEPELLARLHTRLMADHETMGVSCAAEYFDDSGTLGLQRVGAPDKAVFLRMWRGNKLYFQSMVTLTYRALAQQVGGFRLNLMPNLDGIRYEDFSEDLDLWCRMSDLGAEGRYFVTLPVPLFRYRKPSGSLSTRNLRLMQLKMRWIKDCLRCRRAGVDERSLASFIASRRAMDQLNDWRSDKAAEFYKKAGFAWSRRNWARLLVYLGLTALTSPKLIRQKLRTQRVRR